MSSSLVPLSVILTVSATSPADLGDLKSPDARVRKVVGDCRFTEGPAYSPQGFLLFSDIPNNRIVKVTDDGTVTDILKPSGRANGLMFDADGRLHACQGGARRVIRLLPGEGESTTVLADSYDGKKLNSPNDLALDPHGGVYFTDPRYGGRDDVEQPVMGVYYIAAGGEVTRIIEDLERPNGILVSPTGRHLYVAEPDRRQLYRYDITGPGKISGKKLIFTGDADVDGGGPDGMAHDELGNVYTTYRSVVVLDPDGNLIGRIEVPEHPANVTFGGPERKTLYITARTSLYAVEMKVAGMGLWRSDAKPAPSTRTVKAGVLTLEVPTSWKQGTPTSRMRLAQFEVPAAGEDGEPGELVIYYFGRGQGGGVAANVERWIGQFAPEGRKTKLVRGRGEKGEYTLVDQTGTYNQPVGPPILRKSKPVPGSRMLALILATAEGDYFVKFTGPAGTINLAEAEFRAAFDADAATEKPLKSGSDED